MDSDEEEHLDEQRLKAAVHFTVGELVTQAAEAEQVSFSKATIATLAELTYRQIGIMAEDLEAFAKHARRTTVNPDDVRLLARRKEEVSQNIQNMAEQLVATHETERATKKARKAAKT